MSRYTLRDLEKLYQELSYRREDLIAEMQDPRISDYEYNRARGELTKVDTELDEIEAELDYQSRVSKNYDARPAPRSGNSSFGSSAFGSMSRRGGGALPTDDLGSVRLKNKPVEREPVTRGNMTETVREPVRVRGAGFQTKVADHSNLEYAINSLYPYITSDGVTVKEEVNGRFKERVLYGVSKETEAVIVREIEAKENEEVDVIKFLSSDKGCNYITTSSYVYSIETVSDENSTHTMDNILLNSDSLERKFGLPSKLTPYINGYICDILNDALVLNNNTNIIKDMYDFKELLETFTDVKTAVLKEIKESVNSVQIVIENKEVSVEIFNPVIYGFPYLEKAFTAANSEAAFISEDSNPIIFKALKQITTATESNIINIITSGGKKLRVVMSKMTNKAIIRKDNSAF